MASVPNPRTSPSFYLSEERKATTRSEYVDGFVYAMSGASLSHIRITTNLVIELGKRLSGTPCEPLATDMRVRTSESGMFAYPDVVLVCGKAELSDEVKDTLLNPKVIFEVLSPSTEAWDRGGKFARYQTIPSLQEYVLVSQDKPRIETFVRSGENWILTIVQNLEASVTIASVDIQIPLAEIYNRVEFEPDPEPKPAV